jgi:hypothetical protein
MSDKYILNYTKITEQVDSIGNASDLYSGSSLFESCPGLKLFLLRVLGV